MISLLQRHQRFIAWFVSGLVVAILLSLGTAKHNPIVAKAQNVPVVTQMQATSGNPEFFASHEEPNFYQNL
ncbi:hypothetical protein [Nostoc sp. MS1]|uniref:hypothetical protein n=1 Tax=Nostoc sp. MS1 TaxID=2764711 RepID=UPI001CC80D63|nr:hypothetical protein [Nostoc sp. MS1]BCL38774.1 hypothetical protein NSMS1_52210 [Nostoc sp. MS1]